MAWSPQSFNEACKRAAGRRAYNKRRRLARQRRVTAILRLLDVQPDLSGRDLAATLKVHERHNQENAISFVNYFVEKFPFRIHTIRTDHGHEFQAKFHWHVTDLGINHTFIRVQTPRLNGKVERSHRTDKVEFYQLLSYTDDVDLNEKLEEWENFYNYFRPHRSLKGKPLTKFSETSYNATATYRGHDSHS